MFRSVENNFSIIVAKTEKDFSEAKLLFLDYAKELNLDLCFQNFDKELEEISVQYNKPNGVLLLLKHKNKNVGCVGLRKIAEGKAEMKRMYIQKKFRGEGCSKKLLEELLHRAEQTNYRTVRLDTLPQMKEAIGLYLSFGFKEIKSYRFNPVAGTKYMELKIK